jgi:hypothetical protein
MDLADAHPATLANVREDIRRHRENGTDLNPYSTPGMRGSWQRGFAGEPELLLDFTRARERGELAAILIRS